MLVQLVVYRMRNRLSTGIILVEFSELGNNIDSMGHYMLVCYLR